MPKKFSITDKKKWLEDYENGQSEASIAGDRKCDVRTIRKGIEEAHRGRDAQAARIDLLKQALLKHQEHLTNKLEELLSTLTMPTREWAVLSWVEDGQSVLSQSDLDTDDSAEDEASFGIKKPQVRADMVERMLRQHLRGDSLWSALARREKAYSSHRLARIALQYKIVRLLEEETGYRLEAQGDVPPPFLYSYTAGDLFYRMTLAYAFDDSKSNAWQDEVVADTSTGCVKYRNMILAEVPGKASKCRKNLLDAFQEMQSLPEAIRVVNTHEELDESTFKAKQAIEEIRLVGLVPGVCKVCRRLGM